MKRIIAIGLVAMASVGLAACSQNVALPGSMAVSDSVSIAESGAASESVVLASTPQPMAPPEPTAKPAETPLPEVSPSVQPELQPQETLQTVEKAANAPVANANPQDSGHGYWTVFGDGEARTLINSIRTSVGLGELAWNDELGDIAAARCKQLMDDFSHNGMTVPEICAMGTPDAASTVTAWQGSDTHYAVMTNPDYTQVAIAHCYDGDGCHYWCATFS